MLDRIRALIDRLHDVQEVNSMSDRDLDDLGMSREQVLAFVTMPHDVTERVIAMGAIFGLPEAELKRNHAQWVDLLSACGHCTDRTSCTRFLAKAEHGQASEATFCVNRGTFSGLADQTG